MALASFLAGCSLGWPTQRAGMAVTASPADSTRHNHTGADLLALGIISAFVLILIPQAAKSWH
ncbi:MAG TPA: hypothetical protein VF910_00875 [Candidatus Bathyarchaeia archaeon]